MMTNAVPHVRADPSSVTMTHGVIGRFVHFETNVTVHCVRASVTVERMTTECVQRQCDAAPVASNNSRWERTLKQ